MKKYLIYFSIMLISAFAFSVQVGIFEEIVWHGWGGFGKAIDKVYTFSGQIGISILFLAIPVSVLAGLCVCIVKCYKKIISIKALLAGGAFALLGILLASILIFIFNFRLFYEVGSSITSFFIETFGWMTWPDNPW